MCETVLKARLPVMVVLSGLTMHTKVFLRPFTDNILDIECLIKQVSKILIVLERHLVTVNFINFFPALFESWVA